MENRINFKETVPIFRGCFFLDKIGVLLDK